MRRLLDDFVLVSDDEIDVATALMIEKTRTLVEAAGAAALAAALKLGGRVRGRTIALICSGGDINPPPPEAFLCPPGGGLALPAPTGAHQEGTKGLGSAGRLVDPGR